MTEFIFLYSTQKSDSSEIIIGGLLALAIIALVIVIFYQLRSSRELKEELSQLDMVKKDDIEYEFVLKAMRVSTWHMDPTTGLMDIENDFRDKNTEFVSSGDSSQQVDFLQLIAEPDLVRITKALKDVSEGKTDKFNEEYRLKTANSDSLVWEESYATVVERDMEGKPTKLVGTSMRIDERKSMEQALVEARNRAEESDRLKTAFLANMSHEIRTPLNAIIGFTSVLPDVQEEEERKQLLDLIHENTQKLLRIIDDVVNISKVEAGKEELTLSQFDLSQLLRQVVDEFMPKVKPGVLMETQFASQSQIITSDYNRLLESMKHLVSNATKFTDLGNIIVGFDAPAEGRIQIWVLDTGKGVAPEFQERIFERFFKVDEFIPGAGLGLSICRTMAYSMGGSVTVMSALGEGSKFTFEIPIE